MQHVCMSFLHLHSNGMLSTLPIVILPAKATADVQDLPQSVKSDAIEGRSRALVWYTCPFGLVRESF